MKKALLLMGLGAFSLYINAQNTNPDYDPELAQKLGADEYGMKLYTLVILKSGTAGETDKTARQEAFKGHMENIQKLADEGKLVVAGPTGTNDSAYRGIFILDVKTPEEAKELMKGDTAIMQNYLSAEYLPWYGSAALSTYLETHKKIEKTKP